MSQQAISLLQEMPVFGGVSAQTLTFLVAHSASREVETGHYFFHEGDPGDALYVLLQGDVAVFKSRGNDILRLRCLHAGDSFGEMALIDLFPRSASVQALSDASALQISNDQLYQVYERDPEQFTMIQMNLARELSRRLRTAQETLFQNAVEPDDRESAAFQV